MRLTHAAFKNTGRVTVTPSEVIGAVMEKLRKACVLD